MTSVRICKATTSVYYLSFFMIINGGLFSLLFMGTPLTVWRQLLTGIGFLIFVYYSNKIKNRKLYLVEKDLLLFSFLLIISATYSFCVLQYSAVRIVYSFWIYICAFHVIIFPSIILQSGKKHVRNFFVFFSYIGLFLSIGLIIDSQTLLFKFVALGLNEGLESLSDEALQMERCRFLAETVSTFGVYLSFTVLSSFYLLMDASSFFKRTFFLLSAFLPIVGAWFTGSRQIFLVVLLLFIVGFVYYSIKSGKLLFVLRIWGFISIITIFIVLPLIMENEDLLARYTGESTSSSKGDNTRIEKWRNGWEYVTDNPIIFLFGNGLSSSFAVQGVRAGEPVLDHYENTFLMRFVDTGIVGVLLILYPSVKIFILLIRHRKKGILDILSFCLIFNYLFISFISPNGATPSSQYIIYLLLGVYVVRSDFELN